MLNLEKKFSHKKGAPSLEAKSANAFGADFTLLMNNLGQLKAVSNFNVNLIITNYETVAPLNGAVNTIAQAVGNLPIVLKEKTLGDEGDAGTVITNHPALDLLNSPNKEEQKTKESFLSQMATWRVIEGDAYVDAPGPVDNEPKELFILKPQFMQIQTDGRGYPYRYKFRSDLFSQEFTKDLVTGRIIGQDGNGELLHCKNFNPRSASNDATGMSEVLPLYFEINQYLEASNHNLSLLKNGARPSGALVLNDVKSGMPAHLTEEQYTRLKNEMEACYEGSDNSGKPMILEGGLEWQEMGLSPKDMDFFNLKREAEQQIYKGLGVPIQLKMDTGSTFNNKSEARLEFYENRVLPLANELLSCLDNFLLPRFGEENMTFAVDLDNVDALGIKRAAKTESVNNNNALTLNEKRKDLGRDPVEGGDQVFTASGLPIAGDALPFEE